MYSSDQDETTASLDQLQSNNAVDNSSGKFDPPTLPFWPLNTQPTIRGHDHMMKAFIIYYFSGTSCFSRLFSIREGCDELNGLLTGHVAVITIIDVLQITTVD